MSLSDRRKSESGIYPKWLALCDIIPRGYFHFIFFRGADAGEIFGDNRSQID